MNSRQCRKNQVDTLSADGLSYVQNTTGDSLLLKRPHYWKFLSGSCLSGRRAESNTQGQFACSEFTGLLPPLFSQAQSDITLTLQVKDHLMPNLTTLDIRKLCYGHTHTDRRPRYTLLPPRGMQPPPLCHPP